MLVVEYFFCKLKPTWVVYFISLSLCATKYVSSDFNYTCMVWHIGGAFYHTNQFKFSFSFLQGDDRSLGEYLTGKTCDFFISCLQSTSTIMGNLMNLEEHFMPAIESYNGRVVMKQTGGGRRECSTRLLREKTYSKLLFSFRRDMRGQKWKVRHGRMQSISGM